MAKITVQNTEITILKLEEQDYISLTDMASAKGNFSVLGKLSTIRILKWSNLTTLEKVQVYHHSY